MWSGVTPASTVTRQPARTCDGAPWIRAPTAVSGAAPHGCEARAADGSWVSQASPHAPMSLRQRSPAAPRSLSAVGRGAFRTGRAARWARLAAMGGVGCRGGCCGLWEEQALVELLLCRFLEMEVERSARSRGFVNEKGASAGRTGQGRLRLPRGPVLHHPAPLLWALLLPTSAHGLAGSIVFLPRNRA